MLIAQMSDSHVCKPGGLSNGVVDTNAYLRRAVAHLLALRPAPDAVLFTGDLVESGQPEEYAVLRDLLAPLEARAFPLYAIPGNHDDRAQLREIFGPGGYLPPGGEFLHYTVERHPLRLIGLDTLLPGEIAGWICDQRLAWLEARLAEAPERPTVVFMHHPPFEIGLPMDRHRCRNGDELGGLIARHPQVERVLCGHVHRFAQLRWQGTLAVTCPSTAHQMTLVLGGEERSSFSLEPPAVLLHQWGEKLGLVTHISPIGEFAGPYPFASGA